MIQTILALLLIVAAGGGLVLGLRAAARRIMSRTRERARGIIQDAESRAQLRLKEAELEAEERRASAEGQFEAQTRGKHQELQQLDERLREQERNLQRRLQLLGQKQQEADDREGRLQELEASVTARDKESQALIAERRARLERLAGLTAVQARRELLRDIESEARQEATRAVRRIEDEAREEAEARARRVVVEAMQRLPAKDVADTLSTVVRLPNDEMKGRIIGREGRNIRAIEMATGVDLIIDDTPESIVLSSFDPFRRAIAQRAIERLIEDGRIHPARVEEVVARARSEMEDGLEADGESAAFELGIAGLPPRLTRLLGRLKYRVVSGYNLLQHSLSVARLGQEMAVLLGVHAEVIKRAGLLHEIGRAEEDQGAGCHPTQVSADLAAKYGEDPRVVQAIQALQADGADPSVEAVLLKAAERLVIERPGERDEKVSSFIERLGSLETIAASYKGVSKAYAMRSGKELRVMVEAAAANDSDVVWLSKDITARIQKEVNYPGTIKVSVIRETRAVDYAT
ncbi:MAG TPA: ribonuclease Y [Candidatus Polarisedimenticolia bacterium]|nr:ribonuclease Y [Candidatus Polarisedimenticolia bacterium]